MCHSAFLPLTIPEPPQGVHTCFPHILHSSAWQPLQLGAQGHAATSVPEPSLPGRSLFHYNTDHLPSCFPRLPASPHPALIPDPLSQDPFWPPSCPRSLPLTLRLSPRTLLPFRPQLLSPPLVALYFEGLPLYSSQTGRRGGWRAGPWSKGGCASIWCLLSWGPKSPPSLAASVSHFYPPGAAP